jgi:hypothetical protein
MLEGCAWKPKVVNQDGTMQHPREQAASRTPLDDPHKLQELHLHDSFRPGS